MPTFNKEIKVKDGFKIFGSFELREQENLSDLIKFSGGFLSSSYKEKVFIERIEGLTKSFVEVEADQFENKKLKDGDIIYAKTPNDFKVNIASISGSVILPGDFSLTQTKKIKDLVENARGFRF